MTPQARFSRFLRHESARTHKSARAVLLRTAERLGASQRATRRLLNPLRRHRARLLAAVKRELGIDFGKV